MLFNLDRLPAILDDHERLVGVKVTGGNDISYYLFYAMIYFPLSCFW